MQMITRLSMAASFLLLQHISIAQTNGTGSFPALSSAKSTTSLKPYHEVITAKARTSRGLLTVHKVEDKFYFEIPDSLMDREILIVNRINKAPAGSRVGFLGFAGDEIGQNVIRFEKGPGNKVFLRTISYLEVGRDSAGMFQSVRNSNLQPINAAFSISTLHQDSISGMSNAVIEMTDYIGGDNDILFFDSRIKRTLGLSQYQRDNSYIIDVKAFPQTLEIQTVKTYMRSPVSGTGMTTSSMWTPGTPTTFELNSSMILLPKTPMKPRYYDARIGYLSTSYTDYDANPQGVQTIRMIQRWRLEPKTGEEEKYLRGELVEPKKPIVFYIDPATPRKWIPYLKQGISDWNVAFEKAGWRNAIIAREAPTDDSTWSLVSAGHSAIVYKPSEIPNAEGPRVHDPRSGEILESHINWFHNVMNLLRNWYLIQAGAVDPQARKMVFSDELMGQLIRFVAAHEVGHTLGLRHNFGASSTVPVENLRNKAWLEENGHTPSIMDYARFNYVAQPEDGIPQSGLLPRIGAYDKWAIEWGYRWTPPSLSPEAERELFNPLIIEKLKDRKHWFGTEMDPDDPRGQNEDLGDNPMLAGTYGIKNLQRILAKLPEWTKEPHKDYSNLSVMYAQLRNQFSLYMTHVAKTIGGIQTTPRVTEESATVIEFVPAARQKAALQFLHEQLFKTPVWLINNNISDYTGDNKLSIISNLQSSVLNRLLNASTFNKLFRFEAQDPKNAFTASDLLSGLRKNIWNELSGRSSIDIYRRNLQKSHLEALLKIIAPEQSGSVLQISFGSIALSGNNKTTDALSLVKADLKQLQSDVRSALPFYKDPVVRAHLNDVLDRIRLGLDPR